MIDLGQASARGNVWLVAGNGGAVLNGSVRNSTLYKDYTDDASKVKRADSALALTLPYGTSGLRVSYDRVSLAEKTAEPDIDWTRSVPRVELFGTLGGWGTSLGYANEAFRFHDGPEFSGNANTLSLTLNPVASSRTGLEASAAMTRTSLATFDNDLRSYAYTLRGYRVLDANLTMLGTVTHHYLADTITQNVFANRRTGAEMLFKYSGLPRTTLDFGGAYRQVRYVNNDRSRRGRGLRPPAGLRG